MTLPPAMRGMVLTGHGGPERLVWREDLPLPRPAAGEVLIRVGAASVNNTDINTRVGWYSKTVRGDTASAAQGDGTADDLADGSWSGAAFHFPRIQGSDCCGTIVQTGPGVPEARVGQRVLVRALSAPVPDPTGLGIATLGLERDGAFAEYTAVPAHDALAIDSPLSDVELASFPCAYSTAEAMIQRAGLGAERVLITGASGGVGSAAIQLCRMRGAQVVAVSTPDKAAALRDLGADAVIGRDAAFPDRAFDAVLDLVGGPRWPDLLEALRPGGRLVVSGAIAGPIVDLDLRTLYLNDLTLHGSTHQPPTIFEDLVRYIESGALKPVVARQFPLRDLHRAQEAFLAKDFVGKIGIAVG